MPRFEPGDLLFFWGRDFDSRVIEFATQGPSHVGMIFEHRGEPMLLESTTLCDLECDIRCERVRGVQAHFPEKRIRRYRGKVYHSPIRWGSRFRDRQSRELTELIFEEFFTDPTPTPYDLRGALESPLLLIPFLRYPDLGSLFCSALCSSLLQDFSKHNREDPTRITPAGLKRRALRWATHEKLKRVSLN
ncbi:MAG: hypothetical protein KGL39_32770 [Patescibacteria group bacterium]|nr:hypothetical protein [Patescibacteria group bacterium]